MGVNNDNEDDDNDSDDDNDNNNNNNNNNNNMFQGRREEEVSSRSRTVLIKQEYYWRLTWYVQSRVEEEFLKAVRREGVENEETAASFKDRRRTENNQGWKEMPLYGQFVRQSQDQRNDETWTWLKEGELKRETESLIVAAQDQAIGTN